MLLGWKELNDGSYLDDSGKKKTQLHYTCLYQDSKMLAKCCEMCVVTSATGTM